MTASYRLSLIAAAVLLAACNSSDDVSIGGGDHQVTNAQHFDAFLPFAGYDNRYVSLHLYFNRAMDAMWAHLKNSAALPPSQVVRATPRVPD